MCNMKNFNRIALAAALVLGSTIVSQAQPDNVALSPKLKNAAIRTDVKAIDEGNLVSADYPGTAAKAQAARMRTVPGVQTESPNLLARPLYTGKNPVKDIPGREFELAPLANPPQK